MEFKMIKEKKRPILSTFFIVLEGLGPLPTYSWGIKTL